MRIRQFKYLGLAAAVFAAVVPARATDEPAPTRPETGLSEILENYRQTQRALVQERRELAASLRELSDEERRAAVAAYQEANADRLVLQRAMGEEIRKLMKEAMRESGPPPPERPLPPDPSKPGKPEIPSAVQELMTEFRAARAGMIEERALLLDSLRDSSTEERAAGLADLRERNADMLDQQREKAREIRDSIQRLREDRRN